MSRVLLTGASGLLGSSLAPALIAVGHEVVRVGRGPSADVMADLADAERVNAVVSKSSPDLVVNLAASTDVDYCESHPHDAYVGNTRIVENLVHALTELGGQRHLVQLSTDQLYDGVGPHSEDRVTIRNYYALSKYAGELAAGRVSSTVLRTNFFGRSRCAGRISFSDWVVGALARGEPLRVFDDVLFSPLSLGRLVEMICIAIERRIPGVFNVGSIDGASKAEFCCALAALLDLPTTNIVHGRSVDAKLHAYRPKDMRMDCGRFERAFGVRLPSLRQELESIRGDYNADY